MWVFNSQQEKNVLKKVNIGLDNDKMATVDENDSDVLLDQIKNNKNSILLVVKPKYYLTIIFCIIIAATIFYFSSNIKNLFINNVV